MHHRKVTPALPTGSWVRSPPGRPGRALGEQGWEGPLQPQEATRALCANDRACVRRSRRGGDGSWEMGLQRACEPDREGPGVSDLPGPGVRNKCLTWRGTGLGGSWGRGLKVERPARGVLKLNGQHLALGVPALDHEIPRVLAECGSQTVPGERWRSRVSPWEPAFHSLLPRLWGRGSLEGHCPG